MFVLAGGESETLFIIELSDQTAFRLSFFGIITTSKKKKPWPERQGPHLF